VDDAVASSCARAAAGLRLVEVAPAGLERMDGIRVGAQRRFAEGERLG
jgi:hypothetical protein